MARDNEVTIEGARIAFRNFAGKEDKYNRAGDRNFAILLTPETADILDRAGWNVKTLKARDEDEGSEDQPYIQVAVSYKVRPPRIILLTSKGRTAVDEDLVEMLDYAEIETCDVTLNPYEWAVGEKSGVKAYLKTMYMRIREDPLDLKYAEDNEVLNGGVTD